jgi:uncharacterized membrane protein YbhN (UPF0104 family)
MSAAELTRLVWDLANGITAFAVVQGLVFAYACAKKEIGDVMNRKTIKLAIAVMVALIAIGQCVALYWCGAKSCSLDPDHCELHSEVTIGRVLCVAGLLVFSIIILYTRQLFARKPFDG